MSRLLFMTMAGLLLTCTMLIGRSSQVDAKGDNETVPPPPAGLIADVQRLERMVTKLEEATRNKTALVRVNITCNEKVGKSEGPSEKSPTGYRFPFFAGKTKPEEHQAFIKKQALLLQELHNGKPRPIQFGAKITKATAIPRSRFAELLVFWTIDLGVDERNPGQLLITPIAGVPEPGTRGYKGTGIGGMETEVTVDFDVLVEYIDGEMKTE